MSIADAFIKRLVMTVLVMLDILLFGWMGYRALPVSNLSTVDLPTIVVGSFCRGRASLSATVIPSLALPVSIVGTFAVMYMLGFNLDNLWSRWMA